MLELYLHKVSVQYWALVSICIFHILLLILSQSHDSSEKRGKEENSSAYSNPVCLVTILIEKSRSMAFIMPNSISIFHHWTLSCRLLDNWTMR
jgi:hypothetical protein